MPGKCFMTELYPQPFTDCFETGAHKAILADLELTLYPGELAILLPQPSRLLALQA